MSAPRERPPLVPAALLAAAETILARSAQRSAYAAAAASYAPLRQGESEVAPGADPQVEAVAAWSLEHGFALLLIAGRPAGERPPEQWLPAILARRRY